MSKIAVVYLSGVRGADGLSAFARPILFSAAADWMTDSLPSDIYAVPQPYGSAAHPEFRDEQDAWAQLAVPQETEHLLVVAAPIPELTIEDFRHLAQVHLATGNDVTLLCCEGAAQERAAVLSSADNRVCGVGQGNGEHALGVALFSARTFRDTVSKAKSLFDAIKLAADGGALTDTVCVGPVIEVTDGRTAYEAQKRLTLRINMQHITNGVQIFAPESTYIAADAKIGAGASVLPNCLIHSGCTIGAGAVIGPNTILEQAQIGTGTTVNNSQIYESTVGAHTTVGPFAYIRPGCEIGDHARIGDFVELKKAQIGNGTKVSHLTYVGDAEVGERVNFGCGTVVVNYDGYTKNKTTIGDDCFIGCNTNLVAPVTLGDRAFTAAGTTVTRNVPSGALTAARVRQTNIDGWNDRRRERMSPKK